MRVDVCSHLEFTIIRWVLLGSALISRSTRTSQQLWRDVVRNKRMAATFVGLVLFLLSVCSLKGVAQGLFGTISGVVSDSSGAAVPDASVKIININTNVIVSVKTNGAGVYSATSLNPGVYKVEAEAKGFKSAVVNNILLEVNANPKVDFTLTVGQVNEVVEVTTVNTPILQTQQSDLGQTLNESELGQLPTSGSSGRNVYSLLP